MRPPQFPESITKAPIPFPEQVTINGRNYYVRGEVRGYIAEVRGHPPPDPRPDDENLVTANEVCEMLGVSKMWLWRRRRQREATSEAAAS
jgi:hypothetical protein